MTTTRQPAHDLPLGTWVKDKDVHPATNMYGRMWMTFDGTMWGTFYGPRDVPQEARLLGILWHFPAAKDAP